MPESWYGLNGDGSLEKQVPNKVSKTEWRKRANDWRTRALAAEKSLAEEREKVGCHDCEVFRGSTLKAAISRADAAGKMLSIAMTENRENQERAEAAERGRDLALKSMKANEQTIIDLDKKLDAAEAQAARYRSALEEIGGPGGCGCKPKCVCVETLAGALAVTSAMREFAAEALQEKP